MILLRDPAKTSLCFGPANRAATKKAASSCIVGNVGSSEVNQLGPN
jgi:hypothetical protein